MLLIGAEFSAPKSRRVGGRLMSRDGSRPEDLKRGQGDWHTALPDWDNMGKPICDACTDAGLFHDDRQVAVGIVAKRWTTSLEDHLLIEIRKMDQAALIGEAR